MIYYSKYSLLDLIFNGNFISFFLKKTPPQTRTHLEERLLA